MKNLTVLLYLIVGFALSSTPSSAQPPPDTLWTQAVGGFDGRHVRQTADGGYVIAASIVPEGEEYSHLWLVKTDSEGSELCNQWFGDGNSDGYGFCVHQTDDDGYILVGTMYDNMEGFPVGMVVKTDSEGSELWRQVWGEFMVIQYDLRWVEQSADGAYVITGYRWDIWGDGQHLGLWKLDSEGNELWSQLYDGYAFDKGRCVSPTADGGYIITGSAGVGSENVWLIKTDLYGNLIWDQLFGGLLADDGYEVQQTADGGYIIIGTTLSFGNGGIDFWLIKTDSLGNELWNQTFGGASHDRGYSVQQTTDGGYIIAGETNSFGAGNADLWMIKTDSDGNAVWSQTFGGVDTDQGYSVQQTPDAGYIVAGFTSSFGAENNGAWLIRLAPEGLQQLVTISLTPHNLPIQIPTNGGSFTFDVVCTNTLTEPIIGQAWTVIELPNGRIYVGPELLRTSLVFEPGVTITRTDLVQTVPDYAPTGNYIYKARAGFYPNDIYTQDTFEFVKLGVAAATNRDRQDWTTSGWHVKDDHSTVAVFPSEYTLESIYPNPFNPTTTIAISLPESAELRVNVYNIQGQMVSTLIDGQVSAGQHRFVFDGTNLSSGLYFIRATVPGQMNEIQKVTLMK